MEQPNTLQKALNLAEFTRDNIKGFLKTGEWFAKNKMAGDRLKICIDCEHLEVDASTQKLTCDLCGCNMRKKVKYRFAKCHLPKPERKW